MKKNLNLLMSHIFFAMVIITFSVPTKIYGADEEKSEERIQKLEQQLTDSRNSESSSKRRIAEYELAIDVFQNAKNNLDKALNYRNLFDVLNSIEEKILPIRNKNILLIDMLFNKALNSYFFSSDEGLGRIQVLRELSPENDKLKIGDLDMRDIDRKNRLLEALKNPW